MTWAHDPGREVLPLLLAQVRDRVMCANSSYCPREIGARLRVCDVEVEFAMIIAEREGLVELERRWTGDMRRVVLTAKGRQLLEERP